MPLQWGRAAWRVMARGGSIEALVLTVVALLVAFVNVPFWSAALAARDAADPATWRFLLTAAVLLFGAQSSLVLLLAGRHTVRPLLSLLVVCSLVAQHAMQQHDVVMDPSLLRSALRGDLRGVSALWAGGLFSPLAGAVAVCVPIWCFPVRPDSLARAAERRLLTLAALQLAIMAALGLGFADLSTTLREQKTLRYKVTPANVVYSTGRVLVTNLQNARRMSAPLRRIGRFSLRAKRKPLGLGFSAAHRAGCGSASAPVPHCRFSDEGPAR